MKTIVNLFLPVLIIFSLSSCERSNHLEQKPITLNIASKENPSAVFAGGPIYKDPDSSIPELNKSGFGTLVNWTIHIDKNGDLNFNQEFLLVSEGEYVGDQVYSDFANNLNLHFAHTQGITRLEFGLSGAGSPTYTNIKTLVNCNESYCGTGVNSILYKNVKKLKDTFPSLIALNNDDETEYDLDSAVSFHQMLAQIGFKTTIVPFGNMSYWKTFTERLNEKQAGTVDRVYLQVYSGGKNNKPCDWSFGVPVFPGLSSNTDSPSSVKDKLQRWRATCPDTVKGGFMWLYDNFQNSVLVSEYAENINEVFKVID